MRAEQIYDALLDDASFGELPSVLAAAFGARSCVLHWRPQDGIAEILTHSGYYSDEQMMLYDQNFADDDLWTIRASHSTLVNKVWNGESLADTAEYAQSRLYNEWIRGMGDDTFYCLGSVMQTRGGQGCVGLHRGRSAGSFGSGGISSLTPLMSDLRKMLELRSRIASSARRSDHLGMVLDRIGQAVFTVTSQGRIVHLNLAAEEILRRGDGLKRSAGTLAACAPKADVQLRQAIAKASDPSSPTGAAIGVERQGGGRYELSFAPIAVQGSRYVMVVTADPDAEDQSLEDRLRSIYPLTRAEARLAVRLAQGVSLFEFADERGVARGTAQTQLKSLMAKLGCRRQVEAVKLVLQLPRIRSEPITLN